MTSKCCLWTRWVQQNKRFLWLYMINGIILFWMGPVGITSGIKSDLSYEVMSGIGFNHGGHLILTLLGIVAGIYGFSYLHSKKKVDFYHSQPISGGNQFFNCYSSGLLCCYIPYGIVLLMDILIVKSYGILTFDMFQQILANALLGMLLYFAAYQVAILMTIITGNALYSIALTGGVFVYEILFRKVIDEFENLFFRNYSSYGREDFLQCKWSSVWPLLQKLEMKGLSWTSSSKEMWEATGSTCIRTAIISLVIGGIAYLAYKKRPLEYNGPSLAFQRLKSIVKVAIMVIVSAIILDMHMTELACGEILEGKANFVSGCGNVLLVIGICHVIFEFLWELDIRAVKKHLVSTLVALGGMVVFWGVFYYDWFGYDTYVPNPDRVESVSISLENCFVKNKTYDYRLNHINLTCVEEACEAAKELAPNNGKIASGVPVEDDQETFWAEFAFHMKNGTTHYRTYRIIAKSVETPLSYLINNEEYKKGTYPFLYDDNYADTIDVDAYDYLYWHDKSNTKKVLKPKSKEQIKKFQQALKADFEETANNTPYTFVDQNTAIGLLRVKYPMNNNKKYITDYLIFPEYTRTMECLREMGVTTDSTTGFSMDDIASVAISTSKNQQDKKIVKEPERCKELLALVENPWQPFVAHAAGSKYTLHIKFKTDRDDEYMEFGFEGMDLPDWVAEMFEK